MQPTVKANDLALHFATPMMQREYDGADDLNRALSKLLLGMEKNDRNKVSGTTNVGGYHSDTKLFERPEPEIAAFRTLVQEAVVDFTSAYIQETCSQPPSNLKMRVWGWGIVMRKGDSNFQHVHPDARVSGVYYVSVPGWEKTHSLDDPQGSIMFCDPRPRAHMNRHENQLTEIIVDPKPGLMLLFPSYYEHAVIPFRGGGARISIAFNGYF